MTWQPLASAPKDGTPFLASDQRGLMQVCFIKWRSEIVRTTRRFLKQKSEVVREAGHYIAYALPIDGQIAWMGIRDGTYDPTHWMPLPFGPAKDVGV